MERWTDKVIKQHIEDLIEESYILSLSDHEMREYFRDFIDACDHILRTYISIHDDIKTVRIKMALLKAHLLVEQPSGLSGGFILQREGTEDCSVTGHDLFARQIITTKRVILRFFEILNQDIAQAVLTEAEKRKTLRRKETPKSFDTKKTIENSMITAGYYLLLAGVIILSLYVGFH
jgi:hypothetical protein